MDIVKPANCEKCGLYKTSCVSNFNGPCYAYKVMGNGPKDAKVMLIGEALGQKEVMEEKPFVGDAGKLLNEILQEIGMPRESVYVTNVVKCRPPDNRTPTRVECKSCLQYVLDEIKEVKPKVIVPLGAIALEFVTKMKGITRIRGNVFDGEIDGHKCKIVPAWHPAYIIRFPEYPERRDELKKDLTLARDVGSSDNYVKERAPTNYMIAREQKDIPMVLNYFEKIKKAGLFTFDIETQGLRVAHDKILCMAVSCAPYEGLSFSREIFESVLPMLQTLLSSPTIIKIAHNSKFEGKFMKNLDITIALPYTDTMYMHYLLDENSAHGLKDLAWKYTDMGGYEGKIDYEKMEEEFVRDPVKIMTYNAADVDCTIRIYQIFVPELKRLKLDRILDKIMMPLSYVLTETEHNGVPIDVNYMNVVGNDLDAKIADLEFRLFASPEIKAVEKLVNKEITSDSKKYKKFNTNSTHDLQKLFFTVLKLTPLRSTKTGYSTDAETLLYLKGKSEFSDLILQYKSWHHDRTAYIEQMRRNMDSRGRIHTDYNVIGAVSGRIISSEPNLQNIPRAESSSSNIKKLFIAEPGCLLLSPDFSSIEYKVWINLADDKKGLIDINNGLDIHSEICCVVWPHLYQKVGERQYLIVATGEVKKKIGGKDGSVEQAHRVSAKNVVFGLVYGRGIKSLMEEYNLSEGECIKIINDFFGRYPRAKDWLDDMREKAKRTGYVNNLFGRYRRLPEVNSNEEEKRAAALRQCCNVPVQSTASDVLSIATIRIYNLLKNNQLRAKLFFTLHDSVKYNVPIEELEFTYSVIKKGMTDPIPGINFKLEADFEIGPSWGEMIDYDEFIKDREKFLVKWGRNQPEAK